jgi:hypothetical protein
MFDAMQGQPQQAIGHAVRLAIEQHIGSLVCQSIELSIQVQQLAARNQHLEAEVATFRANAPPAPAE